MARRGWWCHGGDDGGLRSLCRRWVEVEHGGLRWWRKWYSCCFPLFFLIPLSLGRDLICAVGYLDGDGLFLLSWFLFYFFKIKKNSDDGVSVLYRGSMIVIVEKRWRLQFGCLICKMEGKKKSCWVCIMVVVLFCGWSANVSWEGVSCVKINLCRV